MFFSVNFHLKGIKRNRVSVNILFFSSFSVNYKIYFLLREGAFDKMYTLLKEEKLSMSILMELTLLPSFFVCAIK